MIHPSILQLGLRSQSTDALVVGANARWTSMLRAFQDVIRDYRVPPNQELSRTLEGHLRPQITYLTQFRPMGVPMGNAIRLLKKQIADLPSLQFAEEEARGHLVDWIDRFIKERYELADELLCGFGASKINDGDVILTYANSSVVCKVLLEAWKQQGKRFRVIIVDARPLFEGKALLKTLLEEGVECTYVLISALTYVMKEVSKVFLGAHAMFANGALMARVGTASVAMMAHLNSVPVMVCSETIKFSERVQLDSFVFNELRTCREMGYFGWYLVGNRWVIGDYLRLFV